MIRLLELQKVLDQRVAIDIPSLEVKAGEVSAVVGPVDNGRDTLLRLLIGALQPTTGSVLLAGVEPYSARKAFSQHVGVLFSTDSLYERMSAIGNLRFFCRLQRLPKERATEVLEQVGLADQGGVSIEKLTSGTLRRLALGRAILHRPKVLLLEEPYAGCEQASVKIINQVISQMVESGTAALILAQDPANLENLCNIIHLMDRGRIVESFDPQQIQQRHRTFMVPARGEERVLLIDPAEILYVVAQDDRAYLQTLDDRLPTQFTLTELEKRLSRSGFFRAHRAYLVNLQQVKEVIPYTRDSFSLRLKDVAGTQIPLSKSAERELRKLLGY